MRDGVDLLADHYAPATASPAGTLLVRGPYGRAFPFSLVFAALYAARGYHVVLQSVRGTFGSGGDVRADGQRGRRRRRHGRLAARAALVHRPLRHHRAVVPGIHPVGAAEGSAAGAGRGRHHRRSARFQRLGVGHRLVRGQRLPGLERHGCPPGRPGARPGRHPPAAGPRQGRAGGRSGCRWASRPGRCSAPARRGSNRGSNTPTPTIRSGSGCAAATRWTASRCRCC